MAVFKVNMRGFGIIILVSISFALGSIYAKRFSAREIEILYVSQEELLGLEDTRISAFKDPKDRELFYGRANRAAEIIETKAKQHNSRNRKVVFSVSKVYGANVRSISEEIYTAVIAELEEDTDQAHKKKD